MEKREITTLALSTLLGAAFALTTSLLYPLLVLILRCRYAYAAFILSTLYTLYIAPNPKVAGQTRGNAHIAIESISYKIPSFRKEFLYKGTLKTLNHKGQTIAQNLPCTFTSQRLFHKPDLYLENVPCNLSQRAYISPKKCPYTESGADSVAYKRFRLKQKIAKYIQRHYKTRRAKALMISFFTGHATDPLLPYEFSKLGLSHILAISGLHFGVLALLLGSLLSLCTYHHARHLILFFLLSLYVYFLGPTPSVTRAYVGISYYLIGRFFCLRPAPLAALSCALLYTIITSPRTILSPSFQLSFGATAGILLFYKPTLAWLNRIIPAYPKKSLHHFSLPDQIVHIIAKPMRSALALNISVNLLLFPLLLYHFQNFPLYSLLYNLFIPFLLLGSLIIALLGIPFPLLHAPNALYTEIILQLTAHAPPPLTITTAAPSCYLPIFWIATLLTTRISANSEPLYKGS